MPPKPVLSATKGQKSLFSFFNKASGSIENQSFDPCTPKTPIFSKQLSEISLKSIKPLHQDEQVHQEKVTESSFSQDSPDDGGSNYKRLRKVKNVLMSSDDEEWDEKDKSLPQPKQGVMKKIEKDETDESSFIASESDDSFGLMSESDSDNHVKHFSGKKRKINPKSSVTHMKKISEKPLDGISLLESNKKPNQLNEITSPSTIAISPSFHTSYLASNSNSTLEKKDDDKNVVTSIPLPEGVVGLGSHEHNFWTWLKPQNRKDKDGRKISDPDYNHRTLYIPDSFLKEQTPAMAQWWSFKRDNFDTVLFFKVGKFYELFHMDADIAMSELDLIYMKGTKAHSGFPEVSYGKFAASLVNKGYRVARIEQTETPEMLKERNDHSERGKKDKVVARELCSVMSKGTRTYCHLDDLSILTDENQGQLSQTSLLICIKEKSIDHLNMDSKEASSFHSSDNLAATEYGVCIVDSILGTIKLAQFEDDKLRSRLRTLLSQYNPNEVILEKGNYSQETVGTVRLISPNASFEYLKSSIELPDNGESVVKMLYDGQYFGSVPDISLLPCLLKAAVLGLKDGSSELLMCALGGVLWQLKRSLIDYEVLSMRQISGYVPPDIQDYGLLGRTSSNNASVAMANISELKMDEVSVENIEHPTNTPKVTCMTLDAIALTNLEILKNNFDQTENGSLWAFVNRCKTQFGQRLLKDWLCHPLYQVNHIRNRSVAVNELLTDLRPQADETRTVLKSIPDLERLLARIHSNGLKKKGPNSHPDTRAILFEDQIYSSRKIKDFIDVLAGFETILKVDAIFQQVRPSSVLLQRVTQTKENSNVGRFPAEEVRRLIRYYREIFDEKQAKANGFIKPKPGVDSEFDAAKRDIANIEMALDNYLVEMKRKTGLNDIKYWGNNKDRYQIEVDITKTSRVPSEWTAKSQKKTHRRYRTSFIEDKLLELVDAENRVEAAQKDTLRKIFEKFDENRKIWNDAVQCIATIDALLSIATVSASPNYTWAEMIPNDSKSLPILNIQEGRHPMLEAVFSQRGEGSYIPNTVTLGGTLDMLGMNGSSTQTSCEYLPRLLLLSGPNMGGKSTLLRQTCLIAILAQTGFKVPASKCVLTPIDRIFTRVGASDKILSGQSTFFVELAETATILRFATKNSLCILDELGRGTATFDGTAIAHAVVDHLLASAGACVLFATHYHSLIEDWEMDPRVRLGHMDCLVQPAAEHNNSSAVGNEVTFLFRLCDGWSPRSYGLNVARIAGLPNSVIESAAAQSQLFEERVRAGQGSGDMCVSGIAASDKLRWDKIQSYFEKLVSISRGTNSVEELAYYASELWRRYQLLN